METQLDVVRSSQYFAEKYLYSNPDLPGQSTAELRNLIGRTLPMAKEVCDGTDPNTMVRNEYAEDVIEQARDLLLDRGESFTVVEIEQLDFLSWPLTPEQELAEFEKAEALKRERADMSVEQFYAALKSHDWFSCFSEDPRIYWGGDADEKVLVEIANTNGKVFLWLLSAFRKYVCSGEPWGTIKLPIPPAPVVPSLEDLIDLRAAYEKVELELLAINAGRRLGCTDKVAEDTRASFDALSDRARYMGAYAGQASAPALIGNVPFLNAAWLQGQHEVEASSAVLR